MGVSVVGKPKLGKDYYGRERAFHFYREMRGDGDSWYVRLCDAGSVRLVYHTGGESVRVCKRCLKEITR